MFLFIKMAVVTCAFYLVVSLIIEGGLFLAALKGGIFYTLDWRWWGVVFAVVWLISFVLAWLVFMRPFIASFPRPPFR